eukprot:jgi/Botrbrau1/22399/Bobra.0091s0008.2
MAMKSFFSKTFSTTPSKKTPSQPPPQTQEMLTKAEDLLRQLGTQQAGDLQWPVLNEATRTVQLLEGSISKMAENDMKVVWRAQVDELQRRLQEAMQAMLGSEPGMPPVGGNTFPEAGQGDSLFSGLDIGGTPAGAQMDSTGVSHNTLAAGLPDPLSNAPLADAGGLFSGLDLLEPTGDTAAANSGIPVDTVPPSLAPDVVSSGGDLLAGLAVAQEPEVDTFTPTAAAVAPHGVAGGPLPEDLFSMMDDLVAVPASHSSSNDHEQFTMADLSSHPSADSERDSRAAGDDFPDHSKAVLSMPHIISDVPESPLSARSNSGRSDSFGPRSAIAKGGNLGGLAGPSTLGTGMVPLTGSTGRKKKITRRVGYGRGEEDAPAGDNSSNVVEKPISMPSPGAVPAVGSSLLQGLELMASEPIAIPAPTVSYDSSSFATPQLTPADHDQVFMMLHNMQEAPSRSPLQALPRVSEQVQQSPSPLDQRTSKDSGTVLSRPPIDVQLASPQCSRTADSLDDLLEATKGQSFEARLQAVQATTSSCIDQLTEKLAALLEEERTAKEKRHQLVSRLTACKGEVADLEAAEARAAEAEDFDTAASLSSQLDEVKGRAARLQKDLHVVESSSKSAVDKRASLMSQQASIWRKAAQLLQELQRQQQQVAAEVTEKSAAAAREAEAAQAEGSELLGELEQRIEVRRKWVEGEEASLASKLDEATRPLAGARDAAAATHMSLLSEVEALRAALTVKEAALEEAAKQLHSVESQMKTLSAKYDKTRLVLEEDRHQLESQMAERDTEAAALAVAAEKAASATKAAAEEAAALQAQAEEAGRVAESLGAKAEEVEARISSEQRFQQLHARLQEAAEIAAQNSLALEKEVEDARGQEQALVSKRAALLNEARARDEAAVASSRRAAELEFEKKAAASARDFKEAGRLAEQAKALAGQAESGTAQAAELRAAAAAVGKEESSAAAKVADLEAQLSSATRAAALALWRCLQASLREAQQQQDRAAAEERFAEADLLEAEIAATAAEADALSRAHGFTPGDMGDLLPKDDGPRSAASSRTCSTALDPLTAGTGVQIPKTSSNPSDGRETATDLEETSAGTIDADKRGTAGASASSGHSVPQPTLHETTLVAGSPLHAMDLDAGSLVERASSGEHNSLAAGLMAGYSNGNSLGGAPARVGLSDGGLHTPGSSNVAPGTSPRYRSNGSSFDRTINPEVPAVLPATRLVSQPGPSRNISFSDGSESDTTRASGYAGDSESTTVQASLSSGLDLNPSPAPMRNVSTTSLSSSDTSVVGPVGLRDVLPITPRRDVAIQEALSDLLFEDGGAPMEPRTDFHESTGAASGSRSQNNHVVSNAEPQLVHAGAASLSVEPPVLVPSWGPELEGPRADGTAEGDSGAGLFEGLTFG